MSEQDEAQECELITILCLLLTSKHINKNHIGFRSDTNLANLKNTKGPEAEKLKKNFKNYLKKKIWALYNVTWK